MEVTEFNGINKIYEVFWKKLKIRDFARTKKKKLGLFFEKKIKYTRKFSKIFPYFMLDPNLTNILKFKILAFNIAF